MKVVVGLGNPGRKYAGTRHNVGFDVLQELANRHGASGCWTSAFDAETAVLHIGGQKVLLVAPQTFMNLSGRTVQRVVSFYKVDLDGLMVISDDLNLPTGQLRIRRNGSAGGQKGLQSIIQLLGTDQFPRLRMGIGRPAFGGDAANYVLQRFSSGEREMIDEAVVRAASAVELWTTEGIDVTMNRFNRQESD